MKKKLLLAILLTVNVVSVFWDYSQNIKEVDSSINLLQSNIDKYENEKQNMISKYDWYINNLKKEKEAELQKLAWANNKLWIWYSSYAISSYNNLSNEYDKKIEALQDEKIYNIWVYNENINNFKSRISENEIFKDKYYKLDELDKIDNKVKEYNISKNYDLAIEEARKWLIIAKQYNFTSSITFYEKWISDIQKTKDDIIKLENEKEKLLKWKKIIEDVTYYFEKWKDEDKKWNFDKSIEYINQAINLLKNNNVDWWNDLKIILENYLSLVNKSKAIKIQKENEEKQKQLENQKKVEAQNKIDYENKLKEKANITFNKIKNIINKKSISKQADIYKWLLTQLETYKNKVSQDKWIILNELIYLIQNELNNWWN